LPNRFAKKYERSLHRLAKASGQELPRGNESEYFALCKSKLLEWTTEQPSGSDGYPKKPK
jgi:hypothetical protein